ncbi:hypothetical protein I6F26_31460 [Ensifer sp. IC3342]|nr:hypothetical protein [Ensifer sp. BRP08]MCA1451007.1 hypothetical protein [Ensifer sp. IC3342]
MTIAHEGTFKTEVYADELTLLPLVALVVGSMIGDGVLACRQTCLAPVRPGALIGCVIARFGMLMLAFVYQTLANRKPGLNAGLYAYVPMEQPFVLLT